MSEETQQIIEQLRARRAALGDRSQSRIPYRRINVFLRYCYFFLSALTLGSFLSTGIKGALVCSLLGLLLFVYSYLKE